MKLRTIALVSMAVTVLAYGSLAWPQAPAGNAPADTSTGTARNASAQTIDLPQGTVACFGWHALCSMATHCEVAGNLANCACWKIKEPHIIITADIQDPAAKYWTQAVCTASHPCDVDQAPVCKAIASGQFKVDGIAYPWVSTYSYRGWCENWSPVACSSGPWADCMSAPCTVNPSPVDPDRPLSCQCRIKVSEFIGSQGSCEPGTVMSTIPRVAWDFAKNSFAFPMPGYGYVKAACDFLHSD